jgi:putative membrane protein
MKRLALIGWIKRRRSDNQRGTFKIGATLVAGCLLIATPAFAQSTPSTADFVAQAAIGDMFEIETSKLAEQKADPSATDLAAKVVKDHTAMSAELKSLTQSGKVKAELPASLDALHQEKLDKLKAMKGGVFDKNYLETQIDAHKDAASLFERYAKGGDNDALKAFAAKHLPRLQEHLKMARDIRELMMRE